MKKLSLAAFAVATLLSSVAAQAQGPYADVTATFVYKGKAPAPKPISATGDPFCAALKINSDALMVNAKNGGVRDVIVFPVSSDSKKPLDLSKFDPNAKPVMPEPVLDNKDCQFIPHVMVVKAGQTITVKNSDKTGHNANFGFMNNAGVNQQIPAGGQQQLKIEKPEPGAMAVSCGSHSWMKALLIVQDHPFVGVSNEDGKLEIKGLAPGKTNLKIIHDVGKFKELKIGGKSYPVKKGSFEIELKPGANDLGTIELSADELKP